MRFGRYEVTAEIGRGGMGVVWRGHARDDPSSQVAIKVLARVTPDARARFERERRLLAELGEAEGFVPLLDAGVEGETPFLVMPFVPGGTLRKKIDAGPFGVEETVALGVSVGEALGRAHAKGIVHRDLKPENVLFSAKGAPLVADLGLGKHFASDAASVSLSRPGAARGTWGYMPREQMEDAKKVDARADVFALGAILFECLSGEPAFSDDMTAALARITEGFVPSLHAVRPDAPAWLAKVLARALAPDPADRFASGTELALALRAGGQARAPRSLLVVGGILVALAALAAVLAPRGTPPSPPPRPDTVAEEVSARHAAKVAALVRETVERARKANLAHRAEESIACYSSAIALDPSFAAAWAERGDVKSRQLDATGALADLSRAIELDPALARAWAGRAFARWLRNDFPGALADASRSVALDPKLARGWAVRAMVNGYVSKDLDLIIADASKAIELDPRLAISWAARAAPRARQGDLAGGLADASRAIELDPDDAFGWATRGAIHAWTEDADGAIADLDRAIDLDPGSGVSWLLRAQAYDAKGMSKQATAGVERALALGLPDGAFTTMARDLKAELDAGHRPKR